MAVALGQIAPDFEQDTVNGSIRLYQWLRGSWCVLFSEIGCSSLVRDAELADVIRLKAEWNKREVKVIGLLVDLADIAACREWDISKSQEERLNFPVVADTDFKVATLYGMVGEQADLSPSAHNLFVLDRYRKVRLMQHGSPSSCRSFIEILSIIDSLQLADAKRKPALRARNNQTRSLSLLCAAAQASVLYQS